VADGLRGDLDRFLFQARQRPVFDRLGRRQRAQEVAGIVSERMKLEPHGVGFPGNAHDRRLNFSIMAVRNYGLQVSVNVWILLSAPLASV